MPPTRAEQDSVPSSPSQTDPPDLSAIPMTGAICFGEVVRAIRMELADGRVMRFDLPTGRNVVADTPMKRAVIQVIEEILVGDVVSYDTIAGRSGYSNSSKFREFVKEYAEASGRLESHRLGWEKVK